MQEIRRAIWSWAFMDWAEPALAIGGTTAFLPSLLKDYWCVVPTTTLERSPAYLGYTNSTLNLRTAPCTPVLEAITDQGDGQKRFLAVFALQGIGSTTRPPNDGQGKDLLAVTSFSFAALGFSSNTMFFVALATDISAFQRGNRTSALGDALGYQGSGLQILDLALTALEPLRFAVSGTVTRVPFSFVASVVWWPRSILPMLAWEGKPPRAHTPQYPVFSP